MQHKFAIISLFVSSLLVLTGCEKDVDLTNIDTRAELEMGLALPVGELSATLGDFVDVNTINGLYTDEKGIFYFQDTFAITPKLFHSIDLSQYVMESGTQLEMKVKEKLGGLPLVIGNGQTQIKLEFPFQLNLSGINEDLTNERLDSMWITSAKFTTCLNVSDLGLDWSEIDKVALVLGDQFTRETGDTIVVPIGNYGYGQNIPIDVDKFCLCLMKDRSNPNAGSVSNIDLKILFYFTVRSGHQIMLSDQSGFTCNMGIELLDYEALWGFFEAGNQMRDEGAYSLSHLIGSMWETIKDLQLRFAEPEITLSLSHQVAGPLICHLEKLQTVNAKTGITANATWNGVTYHEFPLTNVLDPIHSELTDLVENSAHFSYKEDEGHIDNLFEIHPDSLIYAFWLKANPDLREQYPQFRITKDIMVRAKATIKVPFVFKENSSYSIDTLFSDINISAISLDSLCADIDVLDSVKTSDLKLYIDIQNSLPFAIKANLQFLDEAGNEVPMDFGYGDTLIINRPDKEQIVDRQVMEPAVTHVCIRLSKNEWKAFAKVKQIRLVAELSENQATAQLDVHQKLAIRLGLGAKAGVVLDFNSLFNNSKK